MGDTDDYYNDYHHDDNYNHDNYNFHDYNLYYVNGDNDHDNYNDHNDHNNDYSNDDYHHDITLSMALDGQVIFGKDVARLDGTHYFLVGTPATLYQVNAVTNVALVLKSGFTTSANSRWQGAFLNGDFFLVNNNDPLQKFNGVTVLTQTGDAAIPQTARFAANITGHLVLLNTVEGGQRFPQRMRWSDINDPSTWVRTDANEADFNDLDETPDIVQGAALLGSQRLVVYKESTIYFADYVGRPIIFDFHRIVTDEGLFAPYSLVPFRDKHFFLGNNDFYVFDGGPLQPLGAERVRDTLFNRITKNSPHLIYGFAHPIFPEVWWVYVLKGDSAFGSAIVYNYERDVWSTRNNFPHSMLADVMETNTLTFDQITTTYDKATLTFEEKKVAGNWVIWSGDGDGELHTHGRVMTAAGADLPVTVETGDFIKGSRNSYINRINVALTKSGGEPANFDILYRNQFDANMGVWTTVLYDGTPQLDFRATAKFFGLRLISTAKFNWLGFTHESKAAGGRV